MSAVVWHLTLHTLAPSPRSCDVYRLTPPDGSLAGSVTVACVDGYLAIFGDLCPGVEYHDNRGVFSVERKPLAWFAGDLSPQYLASKFLKEVWEPSAAAAACRELATDPAWDSDVADLHDLADRAEQIQIRDTDAIVEWCQDLAEIDSDPETIAACYAYDPDNLALLVAIQRRFRALWLARQAAS